MSPFLVLFWLLLVWTLVVMGACCIVVRASRPYERGFNDGVKAERYRHRTDLAHEKGRVAQ